MHLLVNFNIQIGKVMDLIGGDAKINEAEDLSAQIHNDLIAAINEDNTAAFDATLDRVLDINYINNIGHTALIHASLYSRQQMVISLLNRGANINQQDNRGDTALMHASSYGHEDTVNILLQNGALIDQYNLWGNTALMQAARSNHKDIVNILLQNGASIDYQQARWGGTALMSAANSGHDEVMHLLLDHGADTNLRNSENTTAFDIYIIYLDSTLVDHASVPLAQFIQAHEAENGNDNHTDSAIVRLLNRLSALMDFSGDSSNQEELVRYLLQCRGVRSRAAIIRNVYDRAKEISESQLATLK